MQRLTRAQVIQFYEFATVAEIEQLVADVQSAAQIILGQQGITHDALNPSPMLEGSAEAAASDDVIQIELEKIKVVIGDMTTTPDMFSQLYVAQQALSWVIDPESARNPLAVIQEGLVQPLVQDHAADLKAHLSSPPPPVFQDEQTGSGPFGATPIPDGFPMAKVLTDAGVTSIESLAQTPDEALLKLPGIGQATLVKIREAQAVLLVAQA